MAKHHYCVPRTYGQRSIPGGPIETITVYEPACNHTGHQPNGTTEEARVTCKRCRVYLDHRPVLTTDDDAPSDAAYIEAAREQYHRDGEIEIDDNAVVSRGNDPGAYVAAWVWVPTPDEDETEDNA